MLQSRRIPVSALFLLLLTVVGLPHVCRLSAASTDSTSVGISSLDSSLATDPDNYELLLQRGYAHLDAGRYREARADFNEARWSESKAIIARARIGLGDSYRVQPKRKWWAIREYRIAIKVDSTYRPQALYEIAQTAFELGWTHGNNVAIAALTELIGLAPEYKDAITLWWEKSYVQTSGQLRKVCSRLEQIISLGSTEPALYLNAAKIRFRLQEHDSSYVHLTRLKQIDPEYMQSERHLLEAKCLLELEDTLGFEHCYNESIRFAEQEGEFEHLFREAEAIFNPMEVEKWDSLTTPAEKASFFHVFWTRRDPDPTTPHNERLITHYRRLHKALATYSDVRAHSLYNTSEEYNRLMGAYLVFQFDNPYFYEYDPGIWFDNSRSLALENRGLFFIRHGEPDKLYKFGYPWDANKETPSYEVWSYDNNFFPFNRDKGLFRPLPATSQTGDIMAAMESESFKDPLPMLRMANYGVQFKSRDGGLEAEFYQSLPVSLNDSSLDARSATVVIYDNQWRELERREVTPQKIFTGRDSMWVAVNSVPVEPGQLFCAVSMDVPGYRAVVRRPLNSFSFAGSELELSGLILGSPPPEGVNVHNRGGIKILPRPSLVFRHGEIITVYLEIYGLRPGSQRERENYSFSEQVTVTLEEQAEGKSIISRIFGRKKPLTSLTLNFDRYPQTEGSRVPEHFTIDTSDLVPGKYGLVLRVQDKHSDSKAAVALKFNLSE